MMPLNADSSAELDVHSALRESTFDGYQIHVTRGDEGNNVVSHAALQQKRSAVCKPLPLDADSVTLLWV